MGPAFKGNETSCVFEHLELCRRKFLQHNRFSSFSLKHQEECFTAILGSLQKDFQRTAFAYRKITEEKGKTGGEGVESGRKRPMSLQHGNTEFTYVNSRSGH